MRIIVLWLKSLNSFNRKKKRKAIYIFKEWKFWIHHFFPLVMFRVSKNVMSAIDQFFKSLTDFFHTVLVKGVISVILFIQSLWCLDICRLFCQDTCANWAWYVIFIITMFWLVFSYGNIDIFSILKQFSCMFSSRSWTWEVGIRNLMFGYATGELVLFRW